MSIIPVTAALTVVHGKALEPHQDWLVAQGSPTPHLAVVGIRDADAAADDAAAGVGAVVALVAYAHQRARPHVRVAHHALAVALLAQPPDGDAGLLAAHDQVGVMLRLRVMQTETSDSMLALGTRAMGDGADAASAQPGRG